MEQFKGFETLVGVVIGILIKMIADFFLEWRKERTAIKSIILKEKINAAKKALEYYSIQIELLKASKLQMELFSTGEFDAGNLLTKEVNKLSIRLDNYPTTDYHHIKLFYDINSLEMDRINPDIFRTVAKLQEHNKKYLVDNNYNFKGFDDDLSQFGNLINNLNGEIEKHVIIVRNDVNNS